MLVTGRDRSLPIKCKFFGWSVLVFTLDPPTDLINFIQNWHSVTTLIHCCFTSTDVSISSLVFALNMPTSCLYQSSPTFLLPLHKLCFNKFFLEKSSISDCIECWTYCKFRFINNDLTAQKSRLCFGICSVWVELKIVLLSLIFT